MDRSIVLEMLAKVDCACSKSSNTVKATKKLLSFLDKNPAKVALLNIEQRKALDGEVAGHFAQAFADNPVKEKKTAKKTAKSKAKPEDENRPLSMRKGYRTAIKGEEITSEWLVDNGMDADYVPILPKLVGTKHDGHGPTCICPETTPEPPDAAQAEGKPDNIIDADFEVVDDGDTGNTESYNKKQHLLCPLTQAELNELGSKVANLDAAVEEAEREFEWHKIDSQETQKAMKKTVERLIAERRDISRRIREKQQHKEIECKVTKDYAKKVVITTRIDTGEIVSTRTMEESEKQTTLLEAPQPEQDEADPHYRDPATGRIYYISDGGTTDFYSAYCDTDAGRQMLDKELIPPCKDRSLVTSMMVEYAEEHGFEIAEKAPAEETAPEK